MSSLKIITVVGARPQFIKASAVSRAIQHWNLEHPDQRLEEIIVHTGQHYDYNMSDIFFEQLNIPKPRVNLEVGSGSHGFQTARMIEGIELVLETEKPDLVFTYGDTNSTLAAALVASKQGILLAHIEAGLRSYNMKMPEEINRVLTDRISNLLFCPTNIARDNLMAEGIREGVYVVGDVMYDTLLHYSNLARKSSCIIGNLGLKSKEYVLCTVHRAENTDNLHSLSNIMGSLQKIAQEYTVIFPVHPRTRAALKRIGISETSNIMFLEPVDYLDIIRLQQEAIAILTDSGGVQKEAFINQVPCITLRNETEWVETVESGWNIIAGTNEELIIQALYSMINNQNLKREKVSNIYGNGNAADKIIKIIANVKLT